MSGISSLAFVCLFVAVAIGVFAYATRKKPIDRKNKIVAVAVGSMQIVHLLLYLTGLLAMISEANVFLGFMICVVLSLLCFVLSIWMLIPPRKFRNAVKYLFVFLAIVQILATIVIFILPEAGMPALIQF
mgnify:CR=1 FL=1